MTDRISLVTQQLFQIVQQQSSQIIQLREELRIVREAVKTQLNTSTHGGDGKDGVDGKPGKTGKAGKVFNVETLTTDQVRALKSKLDALTE